MLKLVRTGDEVYFEGRKLVINAQASKGPNNEVVKIEGLPGSNGQKWISLSRLKEGENEFECEARKFSKAQKYTLTAEEQEEVDRLQARIDEIIENAKSRYVPMPNLSVDPSKLSEEERLELIEQIKKYYQLG